MKVMTNYTVESSAAATNTNSTEWAKKRGHKRTALILSILTDLRNFSLEDSLVNLH